MAETPEDETAPLPRELRFLKTLVTVLTAVMILGVITIAAVLVIRLNQPPEARLVMPEAFQLPQGVTATGYSHTDGYVVIVSDDGLIRIFDATTTELVRAVPLNSD